MSDKQEAKTKQKQNRKQTSQAECVDQLSPRKALEMEDIWQGETGSAVRKILKVKFAKVMGGLK